MAEQILIPAGDGKINCYLFGAGPRPVICFHGYGEDASSFRFLEDKAGSEFSFYCIDLPYHGQTEWPEDVPFTTDTIQEVLKAILPETPGSIIIMGFSLGGRMALGLYENIPERVDKLVLLAPDGLKVNAWYWLATQTFLGNRSFRFTMRKPGWFMGILKLFNRLKLVNPSVFKFVNYYIGDARMRQLLYSRWTVLRKIKPGLDKIREKINRFHTKTRVVYGRHDRIILSSVGEKFKKGIESHAEISIIESGHQVLHGKHADEIIRILKD